MIIRTTRLFSSDKKKDREYLSPEDQWKMAGAAFGGIGAYLYNRKKKED